MGQRVNIHYSVEIENLGEEVARLLKNSLTEVTEIIRECNELDQTETLNLKNSETIDAIRRRMASADLMFADTNNIINGYLSYKATPEAAPDNGTDGPGMDDFSEQGLEQLKEKLGQFKEALEENSDTE